jgi:outer membrane protein assembly factor BamA
MLRFDSVKLNGVTYTNVRVGELRSDLYSTIDYVVIKGKKYYRNLHTQKGMSKTKRSLVS